MSGSPLERDGAARAAETLSSLGEFPAATLRDDPESLPFALDGPCRPSAVALEARLGAGDLHRARRRELLRILWADAGRGAALEEVTGALSDLAEATIRVVLDRELAAAAARDGPAIHEDGSPASIACLAFGKLGGGELNYSSDVDLVFLRSGDGPGLLERFSNAVAATSRFLSRRTEGGVLYRVDLRLRPRGSAGALVPTTSGAEHYYRSVGRGWERQALLKARPVAGDLALGAAFLARLEPWVYGRPLLSGEIGEIRRLKRAMEDSPDSGAGNLKTGRGGIRDVEYVVQFLQLLLGAEHPAVRSGNTLEGLARLRAADALSAAEADSLAEAYRFLRTAEHRLQAAEDAPVHALPPDDEGVALLARRMGLDLAGFRAAHARHAAAARSVLDRLVHGAFAAEEEKARRVVDLLLGDGDDAAAGAALAPFGFRDPAAAVADLRRMAAARSPFLPRTRTYFASAAPAVLSRAAATPDPDRALSLLQRMSERSAGSGLFFSLLTENPDVLGVFCDLGGHSPVLADLLWSRPAIMDAFLDALVAAPREGLSPFEDLPPRDLRDLEMLRVATRDLQGRANARQTARHLSDVADAVIRLVCPPGIAVIAVGRLGAREMAYGSDLDLLLVHDGDAEAGDRAGREILARLAADGDPLYKVDTRLRPDGGKGPLVPSLAGFLKYLRDRARTWERQALVRARAVAGDEGLGKRAMEGIAEALWGAPPVPGIAAEVREMRAKVEAASAPSCLKRGRGAAQDAEFLVQALSLVHGHAHPEARRANTVDGLSGLRDAGALSPAEHEGIVTAYLFLRQVEMRLRLTGESPGSDFPTEPGPLEGLARRLGYVDTTVAPAGRSLAEEVGWYRERMRALYDRVMEREAGR